QIADHFTIVFSHDVNRRTISEIRKNKQKLSAENVSVNSARYSNSSKYPKLDEALNLWVDSAIQSKDVTNDLVLIEKAKHLGSKLSFGGYFLYSTGWLFKFKRRIGLKLRKLTGESGAIDEDKVILARILMKERL
ncbi:MAG: Pyruvate decarboxylase 2, partial [Paramarteilia canceri]